MSDKPRFVSISFEIEYVVPIEHKLRAMHILAGDIAALVDGDKKKAFQHLHVEEVSDATWFDVSFDWMKPGHEEDDL